MNLKFDLIAGVLILILTALIIYNHWWKVGSKSKKSESLGIKELIERVKAELIETEQNQVKANQAALFEVKDFDLEINFVVSSRVTGNGNLDFDVVTIGAESEIRSEQIQKIRLHMTAIPPKTIQKPMSSSVIPGSPTPVVIDRPPTKEVEKQ